MFLNELRGCQPAGGQSSGSCSPGACFRRSSGVSSGSHVAILLQSAAGGVGGPATRAMRSRLWLAQCLTSPRLGKMWPAGPGDVDKLAAAICELLNNPVQLATGGVRRAGGRTLNLLSADCGMKYPAAVLKSSRRLGRGMRRREQTHARAPHPNEASHRHNALDATVEIRRVLDINRADR